MSEIKPDTFKMIQKKPCSQLVQGKEITYSLLSKKQENFSIFANDRFLFLIGINTINYASQLDENVKLPLQSETDLPKPKKSHPLTTIQKCTGRDKLLTLKFRRELWQFECLNEICAIQWAQKINLAIQQQREFKSSGYQEYIDFKAAKMQAIRRSINPVPPELASPSNSPRKTGQGQMPVDEGSVLPIQTAVNVAHRTSTPIKMPVSMEPEKVSNLTQGTPSTVRTKTLSLIKNESVIISEVVKKEVLHEPVKQDQAIYIKDQVMAESNRSSEYTFQAQRDTTDPQQSFFDSPLQPLSSIEEEDNRNRVQSSASSSLFHGNQLSHSGIQVGLKQLSDQGHQGWQGKQNNSFSLNNDEYNRIDTLLTNKEARQPLLGRSMSSISVKGKQELKHTVQGQRRNWCQQLVDGAEQVELFISFRNYIEQLVQVVVGQLHISHSAKIYPPAEWTQEFASYYISDIYFEIYFYTEKHIQEKHQRYKQAVRTFKNFDYLLEVTQNQGSLYVPLMVMFEYKGFVGMARTIVAPPNAPPRNQEFFHHMDRETFEREAKVSANVLLDEKKCKIVSYQRSHSLNRSNYQDRTVYFVDQLNSFLPYSHERHGRKLLLRPQLVRDEDIEHTFSLVEPMGGVYSLRNMLDKKVIMLARALESHDDYFVNSRELSQLLHSFGLNMRILGVLLGRVRQGWLRDILQAELAARCLKNLYRMDIQNCVLHQNERKSQNQMQSMTEKKRVISFLNVVFGNTEPTFRVWRSLNTYSSKHFGGTIWESEFRTINTGFFLQALQHHLNITLRPSIFQRQLFNSMSSFDLQDFECFVYDVTPFSLDFTQQFSDIHQHLEDVSKESFSALSKILTASTNNGTYLDLIKCLPISSQINEFLLNFVSPRTNPSTYRNVELTFAPSRYLYHNKIAQIKWLLQDGNYQATSSPMNFIISHATQWLGQHHPVLLELHRVMAQFYSEKSSTIPLAYKHANQALDIHRQLLGREDQPLWRDYFLLAKVEEGRQEHDTALKLLTSAKQLVNIDQLPSFQAYGELCLALAKCYAHLKKYKEAYLTVKDLYRLLKEDLSRDSLELLVEAVSMMKILLDNSQEHEAYFRFIESQFVHCFRNFRGYSSLFKRSVQLVAFPYLKHIMQKRGQNGPKIAFIIDQMIKMGQPQHECLSYLHYKTQNGSFPASYCESLRSIDRLVEQISANDMIGRWKSYSRMTQDSLLGRIQNTQQINRGFQWLADMTAIFGLIGEQKVRQMLFSK